MTSKLKYIIPACLMVVLISLSFVNVAFADAPIWRETNNLYEGQARELTVNDSLYRIYLAEDSTNLVPGETYTLTFDLNSSIFSVNVVGLKIDDTWTTQAFSANQPVTFTLPEDYQMYSLFIQSNEYIPASSVSRIMLNQGSNPLPYEPRYSGFRFDFAAIANTIGQFVQPILTNILPYIFLMIALIIGINAGLRAFRKTAT